MKKIATILVFLISGTTMSFGQSKLPIDTISKRVVFRQVIELDTTYKADQIFPITASEPVKQEVENATLLKVLGK